MNTPTFLGTEMADRLMLIATNLAEELYIAHDRLAAVERILQRKGLVTAEEIDSLVSDETFNAELKAFREAFVNRIFNHAVE